MNVLNSNNSGSEFSINTCLNKIELAQDLNHTNGRIKFEQLLMNERFPNEVDFQWCNKVITLLCENIELDKEESLDDKKTEDLLIEKLVSKFNSLAKTKYAIQNTAQKVFAGSQGRLDS